MDYELKTVKSGVKIERPYKGGNAMKFTFHLKREIIKKNIYLGLSILSAFVFLASVSCTILGENSPIQFIVNNSPIKVIVPPMLIFFIVFTFYRNSKKAIEENRKQGEKE